MILIEFKLHNGQVPYFVKEYMSYVVEGKENLATGKKNRYLGVARKNDGNDEYLPSTVIQLTEEDLRNCLKTASIKENTSSVMGVVLESAKEMTNTEKEKMADEFIARTR